MAGQECPHFCSNSMHSLRALRCWSSIERLITRPWLSARQKQRLSLGSLAQPRHPLGSKHCRGMRG
jgi:hypothetical protein